MPSLRRALRPSIGGWYWRGGCHLGSWPSWLSRYRRPIRQTIPASHSRFRRHVAVSIRCRRTRSCLRLLGGELSVMPAKTRDLTLDSEKDSTTAAVACPPALLRAHVAIDWAGEHASSSLSIFLSLGSFPPLKTRMACHAAQWNLRGCPFSRIALLADRRPL